MKVQPWGFSCGEPNWYDKPDIEWWLLVAVLRKYSLICLVWNLYARKKVISIRCCIFKKTETSKFGLMGNFPFFTCSIIYRQFGIDLHWQYKNYASERNIHTVTYPLWKNESTNVIRPADEIREKNHQEIRNYI